MKELVIGKYTRDRGLTILDQLQPHVYGISDGTILKITSDKHEISAAKKLVGVENKLWAMII